MMQFIVVTSETPSPPPHELGYYMFLFFLCAAHKRVLGHLCWHVYTLSTLDYMFGDNKSVKEK